MTDAGETTVAELIAIQKAAAGGPVTIEVIGRALGAGATMERAMRIMREISSIATLNDPTPDCVPVILPVDQFHK